MSSVQRISFTTSYPPWLFSSITSSLEHCSTPLDSVAAHAKPARHNPIYAPQPQRLSSLLQNSGAETSFSLSTPLQTKRLSSPPSDASWSSYSSTPSLTESVSTSASLSRNRRILSQRAPTNTTRSGRIAVPLPFSQDCVEQRITFSSRHSKGVSLAEWVRLSEKRKTHLALDDAHERIDELVADDARILFQSYWPGYASRTRFLELPLHVSDLERGFRKVDLLDMVCEDLLLWALTLTNGRHVVCCDPGWAVGLNEITFRHIFVVGVVRTRGYVSKWVPVLEVDRTRLGPFTGHIASASKSQIAIAISEQRASPAAGDRPIGGLHYHYHYELVPVQSQPFSALPEAGRTAHGPGCRVSHVFQSPLNANASGGFKFAALTGHLRFPCSYFAGVSPKREIGKKPSRPLGAEEPRR